MREEVYKNRRQLKDWPVLEKTNKALVGKNDDLVAAMSKVKNESTWR